MASDIMVTDHETAQASGSAIKQITINEEIAIRFTGSGNIAETIMNTLSSSKNAGSVSELTFSEIPNVLTDIYQTHTAEKLYPDEETCHVSALIIGFNNLVPEIVRWDNKRDTEAIRQRHPNNITALILPPYDIPITVCNEILLESAKKNSQYGSKGIVTDYFKTVATRSKFTSAAATIWTHPTFGIIGTF